MHDDSDFDAVIIGAGHNGLTVAFYLSQAGLKTVVLERRAIVGGCAVTELIDPELIQLYKPVTNPSVLKAGVRGFFTMTGASGSNRL